VVGGWVGRVAVVLLAVTGTTARISADPACSAAALVSSAQRYHRPLPSPPGCCMHACDAPDVGAVHGGTHGGPLVHAWWWHTRHARMQHAAPLPPSRCAPHLHLSRVLLPCARCVTSISLVSGSTSVLVAAVITPRRALGAEAGLLEGSVRCGAPRWGAVDERRVARMEAAWGAIAPLWLASMRDNWR
jgi:hypothetical protein